jgi:hypothetical protein
MERWWADILTWSSYSATRLANKTSHAVQQNQTKFYGSISDDHQRALLERKYLHWTSPDSYTGIIMLDGLKDKDARNQYIEHLKEILEEEKMELRAKLQKKKGERAERGRIRAANRLARQQQLLEKQKPADGKAADTKAEEAQKQAEVETEEEEATTLAPGTTLSPDVPVELDGLADETKIAA